MSRLTYLVVLGAVIAFGFSDYPMARIALGPIGLIGFVEIGNATVVICAYSLLMLVAFPLKPNWLTAVVSGAGTLNWMFWGLMVLGIAC
ncbi:MAG: hypothetical protein R3C18_15050 [Planctomycetaceae bacterium]